MSGLQLVSLAVGYREPLVADVDLTVAAGEIVAILGPSGSGKSTLLGTIVGTVPGLSGEVLLDGRRITAEPIHRRGVGIVFQEPLLFGHLDVVGNVAYGLRRHGASRTQARRRAQEFLGWVGLGELTTRSVTELSGGQAQRVALARALAAEPAVMLLDEPFSALDTDLRGRLAAEVAGWLRERGIPAVHVTHDAAEATSIADRVLVIEAGRPGRLRVHSA